MAVAFDATSESHSGTTPSTSESSFSWTHTPVGTPAGVLVFTFSQTASQICTAVTYGGVSMAAVSGGAAVDTAGETGACKAWFLNNSIPTGAQTVAVTRNNTADEAYAIAITVTSSGSTAVYTSGIVLLQEDQTLAEQSVNDGSPGTNSVRFVGLSSGGVSPTAVAGSNSTLLNELIFGSTYYFGAVRETTAGQGLRSVGFTRTGSDDVAAVHLAVYEVAASGLTITSVTPSSFDSGIAGIVIAGSGFGASQGSSTVDIGAQAQTVTAWSNTSITITSARGSNSMGAGQLKVTIR
jgi:hypothetical protein